MALRVTNVLASPHGNLALAPGHWGLEARALDRASGGTWIRTWRTIALLCMQVHLGNSRKTVRRIGHANSFICQSCIRKEVLREKFGVGLSLPRTASPRGVQSVTHDFQQGGSD